MQLFTDLYSGTPLASIQGIGYSTYQDIVPSPASPAMVAMNIRVDLNGDTIADAYMVYEPYQDLGNAAITPGTWQTWDAYRGGAAKWWISTGAGGCGQATPCTWNAIKSIFPNAAVREGASCGNADVPEAALPGLARRQPGLGQRGRRLERGRAVRDGGRQPDHLQLRASRTTRRRRAGRSSSGATPAPAGMTRPT